MTVSIDAAFADGLPCDDFAEGDAGLAHRFVDAERRRGRGACSNTSGRFEGDQRQSMDDGWEGLATLDTFKTEIRDDNSKTIICRNDSPDIAFEQSINAYRGCEHGCVYCHARPTHCYLGHSAGLDFETIIYAKPNAAALFEKEISSPRYVPKMLALGTNTDPYQPIERERRITRSILEVLQRTRHPVGIVTKSALITRDIDILAEMAAAGLARAGLSITTLDRRLARAMEPRAATPGKRLQAIRQLSEAGIPVTVLVSPVIPGLSDHEIEAILEAARDAGARDAGYLTLRLPLEIKDLFYEWLDENYPARARKVRKLIRSLHGGADYVSTFGLRQRGSGPYAAQIGKRFQLASQRLGFNAERLPMRTDLFQRPLSRGQQLSLF